MVFQSAIATGGPTSPLTADVTMDRYSQNFGLVRNGLWTDEVSITDDAQGIEMVHAPLDPVSHQYAANGDNLYTRAAYPTGVNVVLNNSLDNVMPQMIFVGQGWPINTACISVDWYTVFEVIPDPTGAFMATLDSHRISSNEYEKIVKTVDIMPKTRGSTSKVVKDILSKGTSLFNSLFTSQNVEKALTLLAKAIF